VLLLIGLVLGWPLMVATVSTQGSDAFDGFSRSLDYVLTRLWPLVWFFIVTAVHGILMLLLVTGVASLVAYLAQTFAGGDFAGAFVPTLFRSFWPGETPASDTTFAGQCASVWLNVLALLIAGYAASYFWTASTIIYFLLRQSEDANHLSEVYRPKVETSDELLKLAGVAASDQPIIERPPKHETETPKPPAIPQE
jgi:hypothetical protein